MGSGSSSAKWAEKGVGKDPDKAVALMVCLEADYEVGLTFNQLNDSPITIHFLPDGWLVFFVPLSFLCV